jgi:anti-sigma factor (TIGR02949 family)
MSEQHVTPETLVEYLHGELPAEQDASIHAHLADCTACSEAYEAEAQLSDLIRTHARAEERELPPGVVARIRDAVAVSERPWWARLTGSLRPLALGTAIAAGLIFGTFLSLRTFHSHAQASTIDAAYYLDDHAALAATTPFGEGTVLPVSLSDGTTESEEQPAADETR